MPPLWDAFRWNRIFRINGLGDVTSLVRQWQAEAPNYGFYLRARGYWIGVYFGLSQRPDPPFVPN